MRYLIALLAVLALSYDPDVSRAATGVREVCHEDQPCWTWPTMGNHKRAVAVNGIGYVNVGPCAFRKLSRVGLIDWSATPRLRGDWWARHHGCQRPKAHV